VIAGSADFAGGTVTLSNNGKIKTEAGKAFRVNADGTFANPNGASFINDGSFEGIGGTGLTSVYTSFDSTGSVSVGAGKGTLKLAGGGRTSGNVAVGLGATLQVAANNYLFENVSHSGDGVIEVAGATTTLQLNGVRSAGRDEKVDGGDTVPPWAADREQESDYSERKRRPLRADVHIRRLVRGVPEGRGGLRR
jgi:hypothetical protein